MRRARTENELPGAGSARCPSELRLEAHLLEFVDLRPHLEACPRCQSLLARMVREGDHFLRVVYPATRDAVLRAAFWPTRPANEPYQRTRKRRPAAKATTVAGAQGELAEMARSEARLERRRAQAFSRLAQALRAEAGKARTAGERGRKEFEARVATQRALRADVRATTLEARATVCDSRALLARCSGSDLTASAPWAQARTASG